MMYRKTHKLIFTLLITAAFLTACTAASSKRLGCVCTNIGDEIDCCYTLLKDQESKKISLKNGETLQISYDVVVESGDLKMRLLSPDDEVVWEMDFDKAASDTASYRAEESGKFMLVIEGFDTEGSFNVSWQVQE